MNEAASDPLRDRLESARDEVAIELGRRARVDARFMTLRVACFLVGLAGFLATAASGRELWAWTLLVPGLAAFVLAVVAHAPTRRELERLRRLRDLIEAKLARLDREARPECRDPFLAAPRAGSLRPAEAEAPAIDPQVLDDLGVLRGRAQLLGLLATTHTRLGLLRLADWLHHPSMSVTEIRSRQEAARELVEATRLRHQVEQICRRLGPGPAPDPVAFLRDRPFVLEAEPARGLVVAALALVLVGTTAALWASSLALMVVALGVAGLANLRFGRALAGVAELRDSFMSWRGHLEALPEFLAELDRAAPTSARLLDLRRRIAGGVAIAAELRRGLVALSLYKAGLLYVVFAWLTFYDLLVMIPLLRHLRRGRAELVVALDALAELEALVALASLAIEQRGYVWPELDDEAPGLTIEEGLHPFLPSSGSQANSISLVAEAPVAVITGSNMTGKSTFLKMCGLNQLLASIGAPVRARRMRSRPMVLHSDINVRDSLDDGRSYFAVEVQRIKAVLDDVGAGRPVLAILDEMFRGTNTAEKVAAGCAVTRWLAARATPSLVATHDAPFTALEREGLGIRNYHFAERIVDDKMVFDHRLEPGPARSRNAIKVLEIAGFPLEIVTRALESAEREHG
ncbi:MAG: hypothetical protein H6807_00460 [Planctomycetes bacterium]|nr:hypothetical protein [Planctomycetota bacterium]